MLSEEDIININKIMLQDFGSRISWAGNCINPNSLRYILAVIQQSPFSFDPYPTLFHKAAILAWTIIKDHVFFDGNKRTAMESCRYFLELNSYNMIIDEETIKIANEVAEGTIQFSKFLEWIKQKIV